MLLGVPLSRLTARLDSLLLVLKSCKGSVCVDPWRSLHPAGNVATLRDALSLSFDDFYAARQKAAKVEFSKCEAGYILASEGAQFGDENGGEGLFYRDGIRWSEWT